MFGVKTDEEAVKAPLATLNAKLDVYEKILGKQKYLAGDVSADLSTSLTFLPSPIFVVPTQSVPIIRLAWKIKLELTDFSTLCTCWSFLHEKMIGFDPC